MYLVIYLSNLWINNWKFLDRQPNEGTWLGLFNAALHGQKVTAGNLICAEHFTPDDLEKRKGAIVLKKNAVPTIFVQCQKSLFVEASVPVANQGPCKKCQRLTNELQVLRKQFDTIMHKYEQTQQRMEIQCNEIQTLKTELDQFKNLQQSSRLVQFALSASNSNDSKVWINHRPNEHFK